MRRAQRRRWAVISLCALATACESRASPPQGQAGAHPKVEAELPQVQLSAEIIARLGVEQATVRRGAAPRFRLVGGEIVAPPGRAVAVTAPVAGEVRFAAEAPLIPGGRVEPGAALMRLVAIAPTDRDTRARVDRELTAAKASLKALERRVARNESLVGQGAGSARALEEAVAARDVAKADLAAARARARTLSRAPLLSDVSMIVRAPTGGVVRALSVAEGQPVAAGSPLFEIVDVDALQVRVPVYAGDLGRLDGAAPARARRLGGRGELEIQPIIGPPSAAPDRSTVDRYYALPSGAPFALGERILVEIPFETESAVMTVPASSLVLDAWGGAWVYVCDGDRFSRVRVDPVRRVGAEMVIAHGPPPGACVVSVGAVELFGAEFPPGH